MKIFTEIWKALSEFFAGIPTGYKLLFFTLILVAWGLYWLVTRLGKQVVTSHLETLDNVKDELGDAKNELKQIAVKVDKTVNHLNNDAVKIKKASLDFQKEVNKEVVYLRKLYMEMEGNIDRVSHKADQMTDKFDKNFERLEETFKEVEKHQKKISELLVMVEGHSEQISKNKRVIKTLITKLGEETTLYHGEKKKVD